MLSDHDYRAPWWRCASKPITAASALLATAVILHLVPLLYSTFQARYFANVARELKFRLEAGPSPSIRFPHTGPYDHRLGYHKMPDFLDRLGANGFDIAAQARFSPRLEQLIEGGYSPPYREKHQAGLRVLDCAGQALFSFSYPERVYRHFGEIPPLVVNTLLFIENRKLLDTAHPNRNPALEWGRLGKAVMGQGISLFVDGYDAPGGSTLATQIEKYRHSPGGVTGSFQEKFRQMYSASLRAYAEGEDTLDARRRIVLAYINTVPLSALPGYGEVSGLGDGLREWYGSDFVTVNELLRRDAADAVLPEQARALRQVLSLLVAQRRPSYYLGPGSEQLAALTDSYLRLLAAAELISPALRDAALQVELSLKSESGAQPGAHFASRKGANAIRHRLATLIDTPHLYQLDRLDLTVKSTLDAELRDAVSAVLSRLHDPVYAKATGLLEPRLLAQGNPAGVLYSFMLYERGQDANLVRVQADNFEQPFDINEGAKLELGSSAKLRTLVTYLAIIASVHERFGDLTPHELRWIEFNRKDILTRWAIDYLATARDTSLPAMLEAAMERRYSASPAAPFFTGGSSHRFENFRREDDHRTPSVREAFRDSINLVFVRLMRDIVHHYMYRAPESPAQVREDAKHPLRAVYLSRFADREGGQFVRRFYHRYSGMRPEQALAVLLKSVRPTPQRLAAIFLSLEPDAGVEPLAEFLQAHLGRSSPSHDEVARLYRSYGPERRSLADRGHLARVHPIELWLVAYLHRHPDAGLAQVLEASAAARQAAYAWLLNTRDRNAQDQRIRMLLEVDAFDEIHRHWKRLGYPFDSLVPSYATALGVSGDRPAALAELVGIVVNGGMRYPTVRIEELHFAAATPYETVVRRAPARGERVMTPEVAETVKRALVGVVDEGTARRLRGAFSFPGRGKLMVGGKTGTGNNRFEVFGANGEVLESRAVNRTATFVFFIGERYFGTVTAYVPGSVSDNYSFTSALPVQILKTMAPHFRPFLNPENGDGRCRTGDSAIHPASPLHASRGVPEDPA